MMKRYVYKVNRRILSVEEKRARVEFYNEWNPDNPVDVDSFIKREIYDDTVTFICNKCKKKIDFDFDEVKEEFPKDHNLIPYINCQFCIKGTMTPDEIIEKK